MFITECNRQPNIDNTSCMEFKKINNRKNSGKKEIKSRRDR